MGFHLCSPGLRTPHHLSLHPHPNSSLFSTPRVSSPASMQRPHEDHQSVILRVPHVLTVAGSDSGAGAGIQADLKACSARGVYCSTVITAVTAQNTVGVQGVNIVPDDFVKEQLKSVLSDMRPDVVKTGMLPTPGTVKVLRECLKEFQVKALVVDPVMVSTSGDVLAGPSILRSFREELLPLADLVTPNLKEASALLGGILLETIADMRYAAKTIHDIGPRNVLVKGGDLSASSDAVDVLFDGKDFYEFSSVRINSRNTHGTGCTLAASIAAELARGSSMYAAVKIAKRYVESALGYSKEILIGGGQQGPFDHFMKLKNSAVNLHTYRPFHPKDLLLYAVTDSRMNQKWGRSLVDAVKAAIEGGATIIQLREKDADTRDFLESAKTCLEICRSHSVPLVINDRIDIALACDADGVHVGQSDMPVHVARSILGPDKIIGVSCKTPEQAEKAWVDGADYIGCGGVYPTNTKENNVTVGLEGLRNVCMASKLPVVAIGGIGAANTRAVMELGIPNLEGVAVVSALFDRESVSTETRNLLAVIEGSIRARSVEDRVSEFPAF
ncbi:thiamine biosynthetic bifunctional enzyme TH1, chloroplastic [Andrographis paniculata]|uniref:thiamine biosynthetic bifunctional enzyme TH1, chloroplastic n=1 Tax=Andrographis paniculata TaxID=175694 RepID=UPI0021E750CD|nr:thiamine biosynthetic bifunctional enzyme TH1, chloroplastic [Andrographis paniculata]XP_051133634.1 thiamine biosynthetic bifunctional enzyme TH1, chloroplastic [Andrographis paniculata]